MFLTEAQLHELQQIIDDHHSAFVANTISPAAIPPETLERLKKLGLINVKAETLRDAYKFGLASVLAEQAEAAKIPYKDFKASLKANPVPLSAAENQAVIAANMRAGQYIRGLGVRVAQAVGQGTIDADAQVRQDIKEDVNTLTEQAIATRRGLKTLASDIGHATQDWTRDLQRIANTETQEAMQTGVADALMKERGGKTRVARLASPDCCPTCAKLFKEPDGRPRIFDLDELIRNGTNVGKKQDDWLAVAGVVHPNCRCSTVVVPDGTEFNMRGLLVPKGDITFARSMFDRSEPDLLLKVDG